MIGIALGLLSTISGIVGSKKARKAAYKAAKAQTAAYVAAQAESVAAWRAVETEKLRLERDKFAWLIGAYAERKTSAGNIAPLLILLVALGLIYG